MLRTQVWLLKKFWGSAIIFLYGFAPVLPSGTWDTCPREKQMWMSSMSWAAQARAPPLVILFSPTCHIYLACTTITLRFFLSTFQAITICHCFYCFYLPDGLLREEKPQGAASQIFQEQKKLCKRWSLISIAPSYLVSLVQHPGGCWLCWIILWVCNRAWTD